MKVGKYPVKHTYKIPRLIADVISLGLVVLIVSATVTFFGDYEAQLDILRIGQDNVETIVQNHDPSIAWRQWTALIFPALAVITLVLYLILTLRNHSFKRFNITKRNAQQCYDGFAFCVSLCKLPVLIIIFDIMCIAQDKLLPFPKYGFSWFSWSIILYGLIIAIIIRFTLHRLNSITAVTEAPRSDVIKVKAVTKAKDDHNNK